MIHLAYQTKDAKGALHGMPSPVDGNAKTPWPYEFWIGYMRTFAQYGATVGVMPPLTKGASLGTGYDPYNHFDCGSNSHGPAGRSETRYGGAEGLMSYIANVKAMGMQSYVNVVHHHVDGDSGNWKYDYIAGDGKSPGRFPKDINCFWVWSPEVPNNPDRVFNTQWDLGFGREFQWNLGTYGTGAGSNGPGYVRRGLASSLDWLTRRLDLDGYFLDDAKGTSAEYIGWMLRQDAMANKEAFAELSDGDTGVLTGWMNSPQIGQRCGVMDFALRYKIRDVCNHGADMRSILSEGVCWTNPAHAITFIEDIDLDLSDPVIERKLLGMAMILGFPGYPMLFGRDLYHAPHGYGLLAPVLNLIWTHETFAKGDHVWRAVEADHLVWERMGDSTSSGMIACASIRNSWTRVTVQTRWRNQQLHDYCGQAEDKWTDGNGMLTFWMPPDVDGNGRGYVCYAVPNVDNPIQLDPRRTTQVFQGASDLDIPPLPATGTLTIGRVWAAANTDLTMTLTPNEGAWGNSVELVVYVFDEDNSTLGRINYDDQGAASQSENVVVARTGWHTFAATASGLPVGGSGFALEVEYMGAPI